MLDCRLAHKVRVFRVQGAERPTMDAKYPSRDRTQAQTPLRCPVDGQPLEETLVRDIGGVTSDLVWQIHAGRCPEHGWFQTEIISRPPREIFPVNKPFGTARRMVVDGQEVFSFPTLWNTLTPAQRRTRVDPLEPRFWQIAPLKRK